MPLLGFQPATWISSAKHLLSEYSPLPWPHLQWPAPTNRQLKDREHPLSNARNRIHLNGKEIPPEILLLIFQFIQHREGAASGYGLAPEISVSHVCFSWRTLSLASSDLWTHFYAEQLSPASHARLTAYLQRSGSRLLDLSFNFRSAQTHSAPRRETLSLIDDAIPHRRRWRKFAVSFEGAPQQVAHIQDFLTPSQTPNLRSLVILPRSIGWNTNSLDGLVDRDPSTPTRKSFQICMNGDSASACAPLLSEATDLHLNTTWNWPKHGFSPLHQVNWITWNAFQQIINLPSLASLTIQGQPFALPETSKEMGRVDMRHLKHLRYTSCEGSSNFEDLILPNIDALKLETLTLERMDPPENPNYWVQEKLKPLPLLQTLHLIDCVDYDSSFTSLLAQLTSNVSHLVLTGGRPVKTLLRHVAKQGLWKSMTRLTIHGPHRSKTYVGVEVIHKALDMLVQEQEATLQRFVS